MSLVSTTPHRNTNTYTYRMINTLLSFALRRRLKKEEMIFLNFTLYLAYSRVGREDLMLRQPVHHILRNSRNIESLVERGTKVNTAFCPVTRRRKWNNSSSQVGIELTNVTFTVERCATLPNMYVALCILYTYNYKITHSTEA